MLTATSARHPDSPSALRIATSKQNDALQLRPRLAALAIVARLDVPVRIAPGDEATIFVGSPLSAAVEIAGAVGELPFFLSPKTWFGPSTRSGELCFASRTSGRLRVDDIEHQADRAITPVSARNDDQTVLVFERVRIPVPNLSLYAAPDRTLWTNRVLVSNVATRDPMTETIEEGPPTILNLGEFEQLAEPREVHQANLLARAFGALL